MGEVHIGEEKYKEQERENDHQIGYIYVYA